MLSDWVDAHYSSVVLYRFFIDGGVLATAKPPIALLVPLKQCSGIDLVVIEHFGGGRSGDDHSEREEWLPVCHC